MHSIGWFKYIISVYLHLVSIFELNVITYYYKLVMVLLHTDNYITYPMSITCSVLNTCFLLLVQDCVISLAFSLNLEWILLHNR